MSVTNLTGCTVILNNIGVTTVFPSGTFNLNFTSNSQQFSSIQFGSLSIIYGSTQVYSAKNDWVNNNYKTLVISGGTDATNSSLISFFENHGIISQPTVTYEHILKNGHKVQVDSAIRDGNGKKIDTTYAKKSELPTVNNGTLTIKQGGVTKGTFSANQSNNETVDLDPGGSGGGTQITLRWYD